MGEFPLFVDLEGVPCLIAGGGRVALRKARALLACAPRLTVAAPRFLPEFQALEQAGKLRLLRRAFRPKDLEGNRLAVAATGDRGVNRQIAALCRARGILVNVADDQEACTCKFPAVVRRGGLTIGVSTGGASPTAARFFKERIEALIPAGEGELADILDFLARSRAVVRERLPEGARGPVFASLFDRCMALGRGLSGEELEEVLKEAARDE